MKHILFMSSREVCRHPSLLGREVVVVDYTEDVCMECMKAIMDYNDRISKYELAISIPRTPVKVMKEPLAPEKAFILGFVLGTVFWLTFALGVWLLYFN